MKKISTLFEINRPHKKAKGVITNIVKPENNWVYTEPGVIATQKFDGTACLIEDGDIYKRYDVIIAKGRQVPDGAIACQELDPITGHWPHWVKCRKNNPDDIHFLIAFEGLDNLENGTYELCGPSVATRDGVNKESLNKNTLIKHGSVVLKLTDFTFESIKNYLENNDIEGIVFYGSDNKMCKIKKSNFNIKR